MQCPRCPHGHPDAVNFCGERGDRLDATWRGAPRGQPADEQVLPPVRLIASRGAEPGGGDEASACPSRLFWLDRADAEMKQLT